MPRTGRHKDNRNTDNNNDDDDDDVQSVSILSRASRLSRHVDDESLKEPLTEEDNDDPFHVFREDLYRKLDLVEESLTEFLRIVHQTVRIYMCCHDVGGQGTTVLFPHSLSLLYFPVRTRLSTRMRSRMPRNS